MQLTLHQLSKSFNRKVVFVPFSMEIPTGSRMSVSGGNGSGKSTLLKILSGGMLPSGGEIRYQYKSTRIASDQVYRFVHFVAPYNTVIEELTLPEIFNFHQQVGALMNTTYPAWKEALGYPFQDDHRIKTFSSGMKQRIKLGLALLDNRPLVLLDEPGTNLDAQGKSWFFALLSKLTSEQTLIMATNDQAEREYCDKMLVMETLATSRNDR